MYNYEAEVRKSIWVYLRLKYYGVDLRELSPEDLMKRVNLNLDSIIGLNYGSDILNWYKAKDNVFSAMCELNDIVNDGYITDKELGYKLRNEMYISIDYTIRLRYATMLAPLVVVEYIEYRKGEQNNEK